MTHDPSNPPAPDETYGGLFDTGDEIKAAARAVKVCADKATAILTSVELLVDRFRNWLTKAGV